jgi:hypothetical protein
MLIKDLLPVDRIFSGPNYSRFRRLGRPDFALKEKPRLLYNKTTRDRLMQMSMSAFPVPTVGVDSTSSTSGKPEHHSPVTRFQLLQFKMSVDSKVLAQIPKLQNDQPIPPEYLTALKLPPAYMEEYQGYIIISAAIALSVLDTVMVGLRFWSRWIRNRKFRWDDGLVLASLTLCLVLNTAYIGSHLIIQTFEELPHTDHFKLQLKALDWVVISHGSSSTPIERLST